VDPSILGGFGGGAREGAEILAALGILSSVIVFSVLVLGLNRNPREKVGGAVACVVALAIVLLQAIYFGSAWFK
jgi:hypothetical protein